MNNTILSTRFFLVITLLSFVIPSYVFAGGGVDRDRLCYLEVQFVTRSESPLQMPDDFKFYDPKDHFELKSENWGNGAYQILLVPRMWRTDAVKFLVEHPVYGKIQMKGHSGKGEMQIKFINDEE